MNNIESTRTLIDIVTQELGGPPTEDLECEATPILEQSSDSVVHDSSLTNTMENSFPRLPPNIPRLRLCSSGSEDGGSSPGKGSKGPKFSKSNGAPLHISLAWSEDLSGGNSGQTVHPSVPPLRMSLLDDDQPREEPDPELLKPISFLDELKKGAESLKPKIQAADNNTENGPKHSQKDAQESKKSAVTEIRASQLVRQKQQLRTTFQPHPNQLQSLKEVNQNQIDSLAALLRKVSSILNVDLSKF